MKVESLTEKGNGQINEDSCFVKPNYFGVFDGATGLIKYLDSNGNTGAKLASKIAKEVFENNQNKPLLSSFKEANVKIRELEKNAGVDLSNKACLWSTSASVVRIDDNSVEYLAIGDSPIIIVDKENKLDTYFIDHDLESMILWKKMVCEGVKEIRTDKRMQDQQLITRQRSNVTYGFLNGEKEALNFVKTAVYPKENIKEILLFTDGMLIPNERPGQPEDFNKIVELFEQDGLENVKNYVRNLENSDPECVKYLRFKRHDDLTAIAITF
jgi:serine/threonine protein phosphatase PrpC